MYTCECGATFETYNKRNSHMAHCTIHMNIKYNGNIPKRTSIKRVNTAGYYRCECGKEFFNQNKWCGHASNCKIHLSEDRYNQILNKRKETRINLNLEWSHKRTKESFDKQSATRIRKYREGTLKPARGVGRGNYSYIKYNDKTYMLRSTYEFIFCFYLCYLGLPVLLEDTRVDAVEPNRWSNTFLSDFRICDIIIEIKGIPSGKDYVARRSFENAGYKYTILYETEINNIKKYLQMKGFNMDKYIQEIHEGHKNRNYFIYEFPKKLTSI